MKERKEILAAFGSSMRKQRKLKGLSQESLASLAGLDRTYVGAVERGERNPSLVNICRLAKALRIKPADLLGEI